MAKLPGYRATPSPVTYHDEQAPTQQQRVVTRNGRNNTPKADAAQEGTLWWLAHELRLPLSTIIGFAQLLLDPKVTKPLDPEQRALVDHILKAGRHLTEVVNEMLDVASLRSGQPPLTKAPLRPAALLAEVREQLLPLAQERGQTVQIQLGADLPALQADHRRMVQVLFNLVGNAITYAPPGSDITLGVQRGAAGATDFFVHNRGPVIPRAAQRRIFEPFAQMPLSRDAPPNDAPPQGTGLGLAISRQLVLLHGGAIWVRSSQRHGTTFWVRLPAA